VLSDGDIRRWLTATDAIDLSAPVARIVNRAFVSARMGDDPAASVVDANLRAHDLDNLYIVDASVLPTSAAVRTYVAFVAPAMFTPAAFH
jgi:choline dehydrogenase-like flavoprotein